MGVISHGSIDIVVVIPMSTSWTPMMLSGDQSLLAAVNKASRVPCPCVLTVVYEMSPPITWQLEILPVLSGIDNKPTIKKKNSVVPNSTDCDIYLIYLDACGILLIVKI